MGTTSIKECYGCGYSYDSDYMLRVVNTRDDTLFVNPCFTCCLEYINEGGLQLQGYRLEVMKYAG